MRWPKEFERVSGQKVRLIGTKIYIYQWNTGKNKNFMVEHVGPKPGRCRWEENQKGG